MARTAVPLAALLALAAAARAEYMPGFSLYQSTAAADRVVVAEVDAEGRARVVETVLGKEGRETLALDPDVLWLRPEGVTRALLFLAEDEPVGLGGTGVAWMGKDGVVLLPDNWGWGVCYPMAYRDPHPDAFLHAVRQAAEDRAAVEKIAAMEPGVLRAAAASDLLKRRRSDVGWYVYDGWALYGQFDLDLGTPVPEYGDYLTEVRCAVAAALRDPTPAESALLLRRIEALPPGAVRREHLELVVGTPAATHAFDLLRACHEKAAGVEEGVTAAHAMLRADPARATPLLSAEAVAERPERARRLLLLIRGPGMKPPAAALDLAARLGRGVLERKGPEFDNLGYLVCGTLGLGRRPADLPLLLAMARSPGAYRNQALTELRAWTAKDWEAADERWDGFLRSR